MDVLRSLKFSVYRNYFGGVQVAGDLNKLFVHSMDNTLQGDILEKHYPELF